MKGKKLLALLLAGTMVFGSSVAVFADDTDVTDAPASSNVTGSGELEAFVSTDVFKVVLPTTEAAGLGFTMDPQGLLKVAGVTGATGAGDVMFLGAASDQTKSDDIIIKNKSSFKVDVAVKAEVTAAGVTLVDEEAKLATATAPSLFLKIASTDSEPVTSVLAADTTVSTTLDEIEYMFDAKTEDTTGYVKGSSGDRWYAYIPKVSTASNDVTFNISGKCDDALTTGTDWSGVTSASSIKLTYTVDKAVEAPDLTATATASPTSDGSKYYIVPTNACTSVTSAEVYNVSSKVKVGTVDVAECSISGTGKVLVSKAGIEAVATSAGTYAIVVTTDAGLDIFEITIE